MRSLYIRRNVHDGASKIRSNQGSLIKEEIR